MEGSTSVTARKDTNRQETLTHSADAAQVGSDVIVLVCPLVAPDPQPQLNPSTTAATIINGSILLNINKYSCCYGKCFDLCS